MSTPRKIAFIRADFDPYGGAERFTASLMEDLASRGMEIHLFARTWKAATQAKYVIHRVPAIASPSLLRQWSFVTGVKKALAQHHFDLIQSNERTLSQHIYRAGDGVHATWLSLRKERSSPTKRLSLAGNPFHRYMLRLEKKMFEAPDLRAIIVNSEMVRQEILDRFQVDNRKIHTIYNGVDCSRFHPANKERLGLALRQKQGIAPEAKIALLVGSGYERKGVRPLLAALARVPENILLWVVGKDSLAPYRKLARRLGLAERVTFWGKQEDVRPFYAAADFFVLPTLYDPFPSVTLEAMASGLPIIVSKQCGAAEVIRAGREGFIIATPEDERLASYIETLANSHREMSAAARLCAEQFPFSRTVQELLTLYHRLLGMEQKD